MDIADTSDTVATGAAGVQGACGFSVNTEKIDEFQIAMVLNALGADNVDNMLVYAVLNWVFLDKVVGVC